MDHSREPNIVDFNDVFVNTKYTKPFEVLNTASIKQVFTVERSNNRPTLDSGFSVTPTVSPAVKPGEVFKFQVQFCARSVYSPCSDTFIIRHQYDVQDILFTKATVKGPRCSSPHQELQILCAKIKKDVVMKFYINNDGGCDVKFHFLLDASHPRLSIKPSHGTIPSSKTLEVTVTYTPLNHKQYFKRIFCLIEYQQPFVLDVHAMWQVKSGEIPKWTKPKHPSSFSIPSFTMSERLADMQQQLPLVLVDKPNIDFGHCLPKNQRHEQFTVTNNYETEMLLIWNQDVLGTVFKVEPSQVQLGKMSSAVFNITFKPAVKDMLYGATLEAQLFSDGELQFLNLDINVKGHSFDEVSCGWAAQYKVKPCRLVMPPIFPYSMLPSYSTLTIHRYGYLPLAFKFHPPEKSNFRIKPLQGLIQGQFQIVFVEFVPKTWNDAIYTENWLLTFNSNEDVNQCIVEFAGSVESPQLIINSGQDVQLPKVHPGSFCELLVDVFNPTRLFFRYDIQILKEDSRLKIEENGEIWPQEHRKETWGFYPQGVGEIEALVMFTPIREDNVEVKSTTVVVRAICEETDLKVIPYELRFEEVLQECQHVRGFELINNGDSCINSKFKWWPEKNCTTDDIEVQFKPAEFSLKPGEKMLVEVSKVPLKKGLMHSSIGYYTSEVINAVLLPAVVDSIFPALKVVDLQHINTGPLFTKLNFWKMMQINKLNDILGDLKKGEVPFIEMNFPSYVCTADGIQIKLLLENISKFGVNVDISQKVICDCKLTRTPVSFSRFVWKGNCPHKNQLKITPMSGSIKAQDYMIVSLEVYYKTIGSLDSLFCFKLTPEDFEEVSYCIELNLNRTSIPEDTLHIDSVEPKENGNFLFELKPVFIGDCYPFVQAFMLYNSTELAADFQFDTKKLEGTPFKYVGEILPVEPLTIHPLLFTFLPYKSILYEVETTITINDEPRCLILRGTGMSSRTNGYCTEESDQTVTGSGILTVLSAMPFFLSTSHIHIGKLKPTSSQNHIIFINNTTEDIISFEWNITKLSEVIELRVHPHDGTVEPGELAECRVVSYSKGCPCYLTCTLTCVLASFSHHSKTLKAMQDYEKRVKMNEGCFIIGESGEKNIETPLPTEDWPRKSFLTVSVTVDIQYDEYKTDNEYLPLAPSSFQIEHLCNSSCLEIPDDQRLQIINVLETVLWEALHKLYSSTNQRNVEDTLRYIQIKNSRKESNKTMPVQMMQSTLEDVLYGELKTIFNISPQSSTEQLQQTIGSNSTLATEISSDERTLEQISLPSTSTLSGSEQSNNNNSDDMKLH